jgi:hypothetical protein
MFVDNVYPAPVWLPIPSNYENATWHVFSGYYEDGREGHCYSTDLGVLGIDVVLMQHTALKDKNGKDLDWWEGDILDFYQNGDLFGRGVIFWYETRGRFMHSFAEIGEDGELTGSHRPPKVFWENPDIKIRFRGNIHDNPELLEETP